MDMWQICGDLLGFSANRREFVVKKLREMQEIALVNL